MRTTRRALTLLEAIVALVLLGAAAVATLQLRAQAVRQRAELVGVHQVQREQEAIVRLALAGLLGDPEPADEEDPDAGLVWTGEHAGAPFTLERRRAEVPNPLAGADATAPRAVTVLRYTLRYRDRERVFEWTG